MYFRKLKKPEILSFELNILKIKKNRNANKAI